MIAKVVTFFDKLEDHVRIALSHKPIAYALIGGVGIVLFWKGVWETAGYFPVLYGPLSVVVGAVILLMTGLLVSFFIGDNIIISGFNHEKKLVEKTEAELRQEEAELHVEEVELHHVLARLERIEAKLESLSQLKPAPRVSTPRKTTPKEVH